MWKHESYLQKGLSHMQSSTNCQDSVLIRENEKCVVAALADGLGSLKYSEVAAQVVTQTVCELFLKANLPKVVLNSEDDAVKMKNVLIAHVREQLTAKANEMNITINDMDCTLVFVCISKLYNYAIVGRLGDSAICVIKATNSIAINDGNVSANGTSAILDNDSHEKLELFKFDVEKDGICGFILTSDGLDNELYMKGSRHVNKAAEQYFNAVSVDPNPRAIISSAIEKLTENENSPFDDDISIAVLSCVNKAISLGSDPTWLCKCGERNRIQDTYCQKCHQDFTLLYNNIRFKDYGGKAAFFSRINASPDKEMELIGIKAKKTIDTTQNTPQAYTSPRVKPSQQAHLQNNSSSVNGVCANESNTQKNAKEVSDMPNNKNKRLKRYVLNNLSTIVALVIAFVFGTLAGGFFSKIFISNSIKELGQKIDDLTNIVESQNMNNSNDKTEQVPEGFITLENGSCYLGDTKDGVPHGKGILFEDEKYYIGTFENGKKDGEFTIIICGDKNVIITSYYDDDIEIESNNDEDASDDDSKAENNDNSNDENEDDKLNSDNNTDTSTQPPDTQLSDDTSM